MTNERLGRPVSFPVSRWTMNKSERRKRGDGRRNNGRDRY